MAVRAYWKGSLKLSLVSCPVLLYPATTITDKTRFHMINKEPGHRLKQQMVDAESGDVVEDDQRARGYELKKRRIYRDRKERTGRCSARQQPYHRYRQFCSERRNRPTLPQSPLLHRARRQSRRRRVRGDPRCDEAKDRVALARIVLTNREHVIAIEPLGKGLLGITLRYPYELRDENEYFDDIRNPKISKDMVELASHILDTKAAHFDPSKFKDKYENALKTLVRRKAAGKPVKSAEHEEKPDNVINLMDALKQSLKGRPSAKRSAHAPARRASHRPARKTHRSAARARKAG
jgi:DNA end-binding protein Ku